MSGEISLFRVSSFLVVLCLAASPARAATYHVSQEGHDANSCAAAQSTSPSSQKLTIAAGVACLVSGDTLLIHAGTYTGRGDVIDTELFTVRSGTSFSNAITVAGAPGETVILQPPYNQSGIRLVTGQPHHLIFRNFTIDLVNSTPGTDAAGIYLRTAHHIRFESLEVMHSQSFGVLFSTNTPNNEMVNCRIHDNGYEAGPHTNGHGVYISSSNNLFEGNQVYNNYGYGFHVYNNSGSHADTSNNVIRGNDIHHNGRPGSTAYGIVFAWGGGNVAQDNLIHENNGGIQVYSKASSTGVYQNTIFHNRDEGIALQYYSEGNTIIGNSLTSNGESIMDYGGESAAIVESNVVQ